MRFLVPLFVFLAVAAFQSALSASLESSDKEGKVLYDGIAELQKIDQMEFEAAQKSEVAQMNVTEEQNEDGRYLEAAQDGSVEEPIEVGVGKTAVGGGKPDAAVHEESESESSEEADGRQRRDDHGAVAEALDDVDETRQDSTKEQDLLE
ncbi:uncharacterized protein LOC127370019 isoform X3 [Scomber scombrus]|uniref:Uncharacterized protein LOC127370019 isoform X3 n=1 Tax=Scomber scombrus TaxID=13677 RepID=A0AAV1NJQ5_SCOSC